jgi:hypothetical protein
MYQKIIELINSLRRIPQRDAKPDINAQIKVEISGGEELASFAILSATSTPVTEATVRRMLKEIALEVLQSLGSADFAAVSTADVVLPDWQIHSKGAAKGAAFSPILDNVIFFMEQGLDAAVNGTYAARLEIGSIERESSSTQQAVLLAVRRKVTEVKAFPDTLTRDDWLDAGATAALHVGEMDPSDYRAIIDRTTGDTEDSLDMVAWVQRFFVPEEFADLKSTALAESAVGGTGRSPGAAHEISTIARRETPEDALAKRTILPSFGTVTSQQKKDRKKLENEALFLSDGPMTENQLKNAIIELIARNSNLRPFSKAEAHRVANDDPDRTFDQVWDDMNNGMDALASHLHQRQGEDVGYTSAEIARNLASIASQMIIPHFDPILDGNFSDLEIATMISQNAAANEANLATVGDLAAARTAVLNRILPAIGSIVGRVVRESDLRKEDIDSLADIAFNEGIDAAAQVAVEHAIPWILAKMNDDANEDNKLETPTEVRAYLDILLRTLPAIRRTIEDLPDSAIDDLINLGLLSGRVALQVRVNTLTAQQIDEDAQQRGFAEDVLEFADPNSAEFLRVIRESLLESTGAKFTTPKGQQALNKLVPRLAQEVAAQLAKNPQALQDATSTEVIDNIITGLMSGTTEQEPSIIGETFNLREELERIVSTETEDQTLDAEADADRRLAAFLKVMGLSEFELHPAELARIRGLTPKRQQEELRANFASRQAGRERQEPEEMVDLYLEMSGATATPEQRERLKALGPEGLQDQLNVQFGSGFPTFGGLDLGVPGPGTQFVPPNPFDVNIPTDERVRQIAFEAAGDDPLLERFLFGEAQRIQQDFPELAEQERQAETDRIFEELRNPLTFGREGLEPRQEVTIEEFRDLQADSPATIRSADFFIPSDISGSFAMGAARTEASNVRPPEFEDLFARDVGGLKSAFEKRPDVIRFRQEQTERDEEEDELDRRKKLRGVRTTVT